jgi:hypothetical protein
MPMMFFYFLKIIFDISTSKRSKKYKPHLILAKKKFKFSEKQVEPQSQTLLILLHTNQKLVGFFQPPGLHLEWECQTPKDSLHDFKYCVLLIILTEALR